MKTKLRCFNKASLSGMLGGKIKSRDRPQPGEPQRGRPQRGEPPRGGPQAPRGEPRRGEPRGGEPHEAKLYGANIGAADLSAADLSEANLGRISGGPPRGGPRGRTSAWRTSQGDLARRTSAGRTSRGGLAGRIYKARLFETVLGDVDLSAVIGLETCRHYGPSTIDHRTLQRSGRLPLAFLRGVGLPDLLIEYLPSLLNQPIEMYSCFISYSSKDQDFAGRLHADLQNKGVRCWFAPHDLPIGAKTWDAIDEAIKLRDKLLLILSENSIVSDWVEDEVNKAFAEERDRKQLVLFPVRIDDAVMKMPEPWARKLRDQRHIGDFLKWKDHDAYQVSLTKLLRDLTMQKYFMHTASSGRLKS